jgi:hypothetical protein
MFQPVHGDDVSPPLKNKFGHNIPISGMFNVLFTFTKGYR